MNMKKCNKCGIELNLKTNWTEGRKKVYINLCTPCYKKRQRGYSKQRQNNPAALRKQKEWRTLRDYGVTLVVYEERMASRDTCTICDNSPHTGRPLVYDHCHITGKFRGVLCDSCNTALGKLGDNIEGLQNAIKYLENIPNV